MQAIAVNEYGAQPTVMELPKPKPGPGQILIKIHAAGMNPMDRVISEGEWKATMPGTFPLVLGSDVAGGVGSGVPVCSPLSPRGVVFVQHLSTPLMFTRSYIACHSEMQSV